MSPSYSRVTRHASYWSFFRTPTPDVSKLTLDFCPTSPSVGCQRIEIREVEGYKRIDDGFLYPMRRPTLKIVKPLHGSGVKIRPHRPYALISGGIDEL